jgi:Raf kinase inhibitor-like YbhB/YbcL family protein
MRFSLTSKSFDDGSPIPRQHTCDGADRSPPLEWSATPPGTRSLALIVEDPDAPSGTWVHWILYDLPAALTHLPEGVAPAASVPGGGSQGFNDFRKVGYGGPCPPAGKPHRYFFRLYALDAPTKLDPRQDKAVLMKAVDGHIIAKAELMGTYKR